MLLLRGRPPFSKYVFRRLGPLQVTALGLALFAAMPPASAQTAAPEASALSAQELVSREEARRVDLAVKIAQELQADGGPTALPQARGSEAERVQAAIAAHAQRYADVLAAYPLTSAPVVIKDSDVPALVAAQEQKQALAATFLASATAPLGGNVSQAAVQALARASAPISALTKSTNTPSTQP